MALTDSSNMYMPVAPAYGGGNGWGNSFGGDGWWIILFLFAIMGNGWGGFGGYGGGFGGMYEFPWLLNGQTGINANTNAGFQNALLNDNITSVRDGINDLSTQICSGFGNVATQLCGGFAGVNASINGAQNALAQQMYSNEIASLERSYNAQTANTQGLNALQSQLAQCCCENKAATADVQYTIATEACSNRATSTANTQAILDKLCQLELDNAKSQIAAEQRENANLRTELMYARGQASQIEQTAQILQGQNQEVDQLYNRLNNCPVPSTPVYGRTPIFTCNNGGCGCANNF